MKVTDGPEGQHEVVIVEAAYAVSSATCDHHGLVLQVNGAGLATEELRMAHQGVERDGNVTGVDVARCDFVQHGSEEHVVLPADQNDLDMRCIPDEAIHFPQGVVASESTPEDQDPHLLRTRSHTVVVVH